MRIAIIPLASLLALAAPAPGIIAPAWAQNAAEPSGFRVVNRTGTDATALHAVRSPRGGQGDWGGNLLRPDRPLTEGGGFRVNPAADAGCRFDLRLVLNDGREAVLRDQDICVNRNIDLANATRPAAPTPPRPLPMAGPASRETPLAQPNQQARQVSTGTGFLVANERVMTNHHVIDNCNRVLLRTPSGHWLAAAPPARMDAQLDVALLNVPGLVGPALAFRSGPAVRRGEGVVAYGFPLAGLLSSDPKLTRGEVNGLRGIGDNPNQYQISAEVQPGNSGGPLVDMQGHVVGVVVSKLNAQAVSRRTGDIAQNVNFAIQGQAALAFARRAGVEPRLAESSGPDRATADVGEIAHRSTLFIRCEK
ncbi:trypsin-like peptidase domain-containing protein [Sediminicoccus rosea]|uniref:Trypsin-like peptidase domain-containing protein n=1 Tax=Sediminicoccus rosea TaxID=1225128 RepID=A0ABZ0PBY0_9PROT|nr:trypsin-like peptidase domain-containing protein [Sediminicoccus rosea]WPB83205.1 trypsin-like peptidase domain-containing protein [Sediminicoccus rosea]